MELFLKINLFGSNSYGLGVNIFGKFDKIPFGHFKVFQVCGGGNKMRNSWKKVYFIS